MRLLVLALAVLALAGPSEGTIPGQEAGGTGVTPTGRIWRADGKEVVLLSVDGQERERYQRQPGEKNLLSVADGGARVTAPWPGGVKPSLDYRSRSRRARLVFRDARGDVLRTLDLDGISSNPAFLGSEAFFVRDEKDSFVLYRANAAEGEVALTKVSKKRVVAETGRVNEVSVHASSAGVLVEIRGPLRSGYASVSGTVLYPDPAIDCGSWAPSSAVFPGPAGTLERVRAKTWGSGPSLSHLERIGREGNLLSSVEILAAGQCFPLPETGLIILTGAEAVVFDDRGNELQRSPLSVDPGLSREAARRLAAAQKKFEGSGTGEKTGAAWVELALASPQPSFDELSEVTSDLEGVLLSLAEIPEGDADRERGGKALTTFLGALPYLDPQEDRPGERKAGRDRTRERTISILTKADEISPSAPDWFQRAAAPWVLAGRRSEAGPWALAAVARMIGTGETVTPPLPAELMTRELAEQIGLFDRARLDEADRQGRGAQPSWSGPDGSFDFSFHVPAERFPEVLLSCANGAGPARFRAAIQALRGPGSVLAYTVRHPAEEPEEDSGAWFAPPGPTPGEDTERIDAAGRIAELVATAGRTDDPDLRAAAQLLTPYYGGSLDAAAFRRDVLVRPELADLAAAALFTDRALPDSFFARLLSDVLLAARGRSRNPTGCVDLMKRLDEEDREEPDSYCVLLTQIVGGAVYDADEGEEGTGRSRQLAELTRSASAPPELRLFGKLGRTFIGQASTRDILDLWNEPDLPREIRTRILGMAGYSPEGTKPIDEIVPDLLRQLREGRLSGPEESAVASLLGRTSPAELSRLTVERLLAGKLKIEGADDADTWLSSIGKDAVASDPHLREALRGLLADEDTRPRAAALLAKAGDQAALAPLVVALKTGCFG